MAVPSGMLPALGEGMQTFWQEEAFVDYTIEVEDQQFKVHKLIMASASDYFKALLRGDMVESGKDRVRLMGQNPLAVSSMIEFIYTGQFGSTHVDTKELLACAMYLLIPPAIEVCCQLLCDKLNAQNCVDILATLEAFSREEGIEHTVKYIRSHIDEVLNVCQLDKMSPDKLRILIDCWGKSEWKLFVTIKEWVEVDFHNRSQHLNNLMSRVRFALMTQEELETVKNMDIFSGSDGSWRDLVAEAEEYHKLPVHLRVLDESEQCMVRADPTPVCFVAEEDSNGVFHAVEGKAWIQHQALDHPEVGFMITASITVNNFLLACKLGKWYAFDPRTNRWSSVTQMPQKSQFGVVYCNKQLYIFGGKLNGTLGPFTDSIERYDLATNHWSVLPSKMPAVLEGFSACSLDGVIYVGGGWIAGDYCVDSVLGCYLPNRKFSTRMDCFDPTTNTWSSKARVPEAFQDCVLQVMELCKEDVIFVMDRGFYMQCYRPSTDQWSAYDPLCGAHTHLVVSWRNIASPSEKTLFFVDFPHERVYARGQKRKYITYDNDGTTFGACQVWTTRQKGKKAIVKKLDDFPLDENDEDGEPSSYFLALLAFAPQSVGDN